MKNYAEIKNKRVVQVMCCDADLISNLQGLDATRIFIEIPFFCGGSELYLSATNEVVRRPAQLFSPALWDYENNVWFDPRSPAEQEAAQWGVVRVRRNQLLAQSDWTQLPDVPLPTKDAWAAYRQALRDVTGQPDPFNIIWPTAP